MEIKEDKQFNTNNGSIVGKLTYKKFSMMFTGDCERQSEAKIIANNAAADLKCDVLKSGHHGVTTSSTKKFVEHSARSRFCLSTENLAHNQAFINDLQFLPLCRRVIIKKTLGGGANDH